MICLATIDYPLYTTKISLEIISYCICLKNTIESIILLLFSPNFLNVLDRWSLLGFSSQTGWMRGIWYLQALRVYDSMTLFSDSEKPLFPTMNSIIFSLTLNRDDLPRWQLNLVLENAGWWQVQIQYCKPPIYEWVPFWEHICKSNLFTSPTKFA